METASGRNFSTKDWDRGRTSFNYFGQNLDLAKVLVDITRKDLHHSQELAKKAGLPCPVVDYVVETVNNNTYKELMERWGSI